jgi:hypothetical protein
VELAASQYPPVFIPKYFFAKDEWAVKAENDSVTRAGLALSVLLKFNGSGSKLEKKEK